MTDTLTIAERSRLMAKIKGKNTGPERMVRSLLHRAGYRFRLHVRALPGTPDIVLPRHRAVVFVHGCFWHRHKGCKIASTPKSHRKFWTAKFARNVANDRKHLRQLRRMGWRVVTLWECQLKRPEHVLARMEKVRQPSKTLYALSTPDILNVAAESRSAYGAPARRACLAAPVRYHPPQCLRSTTSGSSSSTPSTAAMSAPPAAP